jgi:hypothetical protein
MRAPKISETDLAKAVVSSLSEWGWEVYQEVDGVGGRCDIVGKRGPILWAIECKVTLGLSVIEQAFKWRFRAHYVSVAVPSTRRRNGFAWKVCGDYGVGVFTVRGVGERANVVEEVRPRLSRKIKPIVLHEEQKTFCEAGGNHGGHWTNFKGTVRNLVNYVNRNPGVEFNHAIRNIDHHYGTFGTAKSCLRGFIGTVIPELRTEIVNRKLCVFPVEGAR